MTVLYEKEGRIAIITINRPEVMNALDFETMDNLYEAWSDFRDNNDLWVAILTGAGDKAFSAGADLKKMLPASTNLSEVEKRDRDLYEPGFAVITRNFDLWKPIICAINGIALGGGTEMALACDIRIAASHAKMALPEVKWGIIPGAGGTQRLPRAVPMGIAMEMILTGKTIDAQEAYRIGLVNKVVPLEELMPTAMKMAETICSQGPLAIRAAKEAIIKGTGMPLDEGLRLEAFLSSYLHATEDAVEGPMAFIQKRKPDFKAR